MCFCHVLHSRRQELGHKRIRHLSSFSRRIPCALLIRLSAVRILFINVPASCTSYPSCLTINDLDPMAGGISIVPLKLAFRRFLECGSSSIRSIAKDGKEQAYQSAVRLLIGIPFHSDQLIKVTVRAHFSGFVRHFRAVNRLLQLSFFV